MQPVTPQRIVKIETLCISHLPLLRVHTDQGLIGSGESFYAPQAVAAMLHDWMSNRLIGANALDIEKQWCFFYERFINFGGRGAELRALSALDLALWDILCQSCELPIWQLLGGRTRELIPAYCSPGGTSYGVVDPTWVGGISETKRIADMAIPYNIPVAMHDCTGPLTLLAGLHVGVANHNVVFQETVRAHLRIVYPKLIDQEISVVQGAIAPPDRVGIGAAWLPDLFSNDHPSYRVTT